MRLLLVMALAIAIGAAWTFSEITPRHFGACHEVPVTIGKDATVTDCQAYGLTDFAVPLVILGLMVVLISEGDVKLTIPGVATVEKTRSGKAAVGVLAEEKPTLDKRAEEYLGAISAEILRTMNIDVRGEEFIETLMPQDDEERPE